MANSKLDNPFFSPKLLIPAEKIHLITVEQFYNQYHKPPRKITARVFAYILELWTVAGNPTDGVPVNSERLRYILDIHKRSWEKSLDYLQQDNIISWEKSRPNHPSIAKILTTEKNLGKLPQDEVRLYQI